MFVPASEHVPDGLTINYEERTSSISCTSFSCTTATQEACSSSKKFEPGNQTFKPDNEKFKPGEAQIRIRKI